MSADRAALGRSIEQKRAGAENTQEQIDALVRSFTDGTLNEAEFTPWLRAVVDHGLSIDETAWLTQAMAASGITLSWSGVSGIVVDKHSTGGVGDDVSLIAVPLAASCGVKVAKLSGRALGHTGGTIDKLECIPGIRTHLTVDGFETQVAEVGCAIAQATDDLAPADKKIYALRHRTNTIQSVGLITASVLSKKIAGGAPHLVIDVKCGRCAFMQTEADAFALARSIVHVACRLGRWITVLLTDMDAPLGNSIGDLLELDEALAVLAGHKHGRLRDVALAVAEAMLAVHEGDQRTGAEARIAKLEAALHDGTAYRRFAAMVAAQGGDLKALPTITQPTQSVEAASDGFVDAVDGRAIGEALAAARCGRDPVTSTTLGVRLRKRIGDAVIAGEPLAEIFGDGLAPTVRDAISIAAYAPKERRAIIHRLHSAPLRVQ